MLSKPRRTPKAPNRFPRPGGCGMKFEQGDYIGGDECGRGSWAGPMVVCMAAIKPGRVDGVRDSKTIPRERIPELARALMDACISYKVVMLSAKFIDDHGLEKAWNKGMCEALAAIRKECDYDAIIDGYALPTEGDRVTAFPKADTMVYQVSAASIIAKSHQMNEMATADRNYPQYEFCNSMGYGTKRHMELLKKYGPCPIHRQSFRPVASPDDPFDREGLKFTPQAAAGMLSKLEGFENSTFAGLWEKQFITDCKGKLNTGKGLSSRDMFFLRGISTRHR
jgi:ribonuclease HII